MGRPADMPARSASRGSTQGSAPAGAGEAAGAGEKGKGMGIIVKEEYVCDYCGTGINGERALVGRLSLRKAGARGLARNMQVLLHAECSDKLIRYAKPIAPETKRVRNGAE
jgi:hypothetical protein